MPKALPDEISESRRTLNGVGNKKDNKGNLTSQASSKNNRSFKPNEDCKVN